MQKYELTVLFKPLLFEDIKNGSLKKIMSLISELKGKMEETDNMGKKLLAYPIKRFKEGYYVEYEVELNPTKIVEFRRALDLTQDILRYIMIKK